MWAIFLLATLCFAIVGLIVAFIGNKIYLKMEKDNAKVKREIEREKKKEEKELNE